ncbi:MAG: tetratricopeptide repeat protein, partial [Magnetospirillum sp.]|nr:tetratricopeptide repeat protein [Magnetospirillum sp.]
DAIATVKAANGPVHGSVANVLVAQGDLLVEKSRHADALAPFAEAAGIREKVLGTANKNTAQAYFKAASAARDSAQTEAGVAHATKAMEIYERMDGPDSRDAARSRSILADTLMRSGRAGEAEPLFRRNLAVFLNKPEPGDTWGPYTQRKLGYALGASGRRSEGIQMLRDAVALYDQTQGAEDYDLAVVRSDLADLLRDEGRHGEAVALRSDAITLFEAARGAQSLAAAWEWQRLGYSLASLNRHDDAIAAYGLSLAILEAKAPNDLRGQAGLVASMGSELREAGRLAEAEPLIRRSVDMYEKALGRRHAALAWPLHLLSSLYADQGNSAEADRLLRRELALALVHEDLAALWRAGRDLGPNWVLSGRSEQGALLLKMGANANLAMARRDGGAVPSNRTAIFTMLGDALSAFGRDAEAREARSLMEDGRNEMPLNAGEAAWRDRLRDVAAKVRRAEGEAAELGWQTLELTIGDLAATKALVSRTM